MADVTYRFTGIPQGVQASVEDVTAPGVEVITVTGGAGGYGDADLPVGDYVAIYSDLGLQHRVAGDLAAPTDTDYARSSTGGSAASGTVAGRFSAVPPSLPVAAGEGANLTLSDDAGAMATISGLDLSAGEMVFPSGGLYLVTGDATFTTTDPGLIEVALHGASWNITLTSVDAVPAGEWTGSFMQVVAVEDTTITSDPLVQFSIYADADITAFGSLSATVVKLA